VARRLLSTWPGPPVLQAVQPDGDDDDRCRSSRGRTTRARRSTGPRPIPPGIACTIRNTARLEDVRIDAGKRALEQEFSVAGAARVAGFGTPESMRRAFVLRVGVAPRTYQQRFGSATNGLRSPAR
jgi:AraC-like DNA-binding protein